MHFFDPYSPFLNYQFFNLDGMLIMHHNQEQLQQMVQLISQLFKGLGLLVNHKKSLLIPMQQLEFLGFGICSQTMQISIPLEKLWKIQQDASQLMTQQIVSIREIACFVGAMIWAIPTAPLHYRALQLLMNSVLHSARDNKKVSSWIKQARGI